MEETSIDARINQLPEMQRQQVLDLILACSISQSKRRSKSKHPINRLY